MESINKIKEVVTAEYRKYPERKVIEPEVAKVGDTYENTYKDSMKLAMIRSRIEAKYYNDPKILEKIALAVFSVI